ncbi:beta-ketoacyl synthase N-terminal-like domain-containing protein [Amycolatopsis cynarae]|uniref:Beta-ketoacyl synthase N-terminal-like domain-containing protein n=1 Tax=Amycolatopsis cynarae TaxID=2995223 RepID=A0ABY7B7C7_9PSEU|nr:beta-ketoacyl synthase N-terminal-like domain-containing protein [Amycolatopsis sp. HUAS 11-8]WAL68235.1 beta-ketoacyl synthase N-terminal-like domain-containing protein [Amycolatopsis sp. HUAS 11-8]
MGTWLPITLRGVGLTLPGLDKPCYDFDEFAGAVLSGSCAITPLAGTGTPIRVAGQVPGDGDEHLVLPEKLLRRMTRASRFAHSAVTRALEDAGLTAGQISAGDAVLVVSSYQFALPETIALFERFEREGPAAVAFDYWVSTAPAAIASGMATNLGLQIPTVSLTGGCSTSMRAFELAASMVGRGEVDHAIVVGVDTPLEPLYLSATGHPGRSGHHASSLSGDPSDVRPHDEHQTGNAPAEGAAAVVLGRPGHRGSRTFEGEFQALSTRNGGRNPMGLGTPEPCAADLARLLRGAGLSLRDLAFFCDFAEGNRQLEDFLCDTLSALRRTLGDDEPLPLTSQEACFGHLPGAAGLLKVLASVLMLDQRRVAPTANLVTPYSRLPAQPVAGEPAPITDPARRTALAVGLSGGGDATSVLLRAV